MSEHPLQEKQLIRRIALEHAVQLERDAGGTDTGEILRQAAKFAAFIEDGVVPVGEPDEDDEDREARQIADEDRRG